MLKLFQDGDRASVEESVGSCLALDISNAKDVSSACCAVEDVLKKIGHDLVSVLFYDGNNRADEYCPFVRLPRAIDDMLKQIRRKRQGPIWQQMHQVMQPFDWMKVTELSSNDFLAKRFMTEVQRMPYQAIYAIPVIVGQAIAVFSVGITQKDCEKTALAEISIIVNQATLSLVCRFPELTSLFASRRLTVKETEVMSLCISGLSNGAIAEAMGVTENTILLIQRSAESRLEAKNLAQALAKALALGEISHM